MRKIILFLCFISVSNPSFAAWSIIQKVNQAGVSTGGTATISATGSGNLIVVLGIIPSSGAVSSITDGGNTYVDCGAIGARSTARDIIWYAENSISGKTTLTFNFSGGGSANFYIYEVSGIATSSSLDQAAHVDDQAASTTPLGAAVTTSQAGDFIASIGESAGSISAIHAGNEFTSDQLQSGNSYSSITSTSATAGSHQAQWDSTNSIYSSVTASFKIPSSVNKSNFFQVISI